jgi:rubrerythrin
MAIDPSEALFEALEREKWAYRKYSEAVEKFEDEEVKELFRFLAEEEKKHVKMIQDELDREVYKEF